MIAHVCEYAQSCLTLGDPMDGSPPGCSVPGVSQATILKLVAISFSRVLPDPGIELTSSESPALAGRVSTSESSGKLMIAYKL